MMALSTRRARTRAEASPAPAQLQRRIDPERDPDVGYFRRKAIRLRRLGIKPIGRGGPPAEPAEPSPEHNAAVVGEHNIAVRVELHEIDKHTKMVEARLGTAGIGNYEAQELSAELRMLRTLRAEVEGERDRPIMMTDDKRAFIRARAAELRESYWHAAERCSRAGDHREARRCRVDAVRARHVAEHEAGLRSSLPGFTTMWS